MSADLRRGGPPTLAVLGALWAAVAVGLLILDPGAFALSTATTVLQFSTILALVALGQSVVILCGGAGIDLSVGGTTSLSAVLTMLALRAGLPELLVPVSCIGFGGCSAF